MPRTARSSNERGVILFDCRWEAAAPLPASMSVDEVLLWRNRLADKGLIGVDDNGIGFGNVSARVNEESSDFVITGSQTGHIRTLIRAELALVTKIDVAANRVWCRGPVKASSESLTHGVIYLLQDRVSGVVHVHHPELWQTCIHRYPTTSDNVEAGTLEMAAEIERQLRSRNEVGGDLLVMAGHYGGLLSYGPDVASCANLLLNLLEDHDVD